MKQLLITATVFTIFFGNYVYATGYIRIICKSNHSQIELSHFGMRDSVTIHMLNYGSEDPHRPNSNYSLNGQDLSIVDDGVRFYLRGVFEKFEPSYPTPNLEIRLADYPFMVLEKGICKIGII